MTKLLIAYVVACFAAVILAPLVGMVFTPLYLVVAKVRARGRKMFGPWLCFLVSAIAMFAVMQGFVYAAGRMGVAPSFLMFVVPHLGVMFTDFRQIDAAKAGGCLVLRRRLPPEDAALRVRMEYGSMAGDVLGLWLPLLLLSGPPRLW